VSALRTGYAIGLGAGVDKRGYANWRIHRLPNKNKGETRFRVFHWNTRIPHLNTRDAAKCPQLWTVGIRCSGIANPNATRTQPERNPNAPVAGLDGWRCERGYGGPRWAVGLRALGTLAVVMVEDGGLPGFGASWWQLRTTRERPGRRREDRTAHPNGNRSRPPRSPPGPIRYVPLIQAPIFNCPLGSIQLC